METSLQNRTISGILWTTFQRGGGLLIGFIGNVILARLLSPLDYGCVGILLIFTSIADIIIDGGLGSALIQKREIKKIDCSTIFTTNLFISFFLFGLLFFFAPFISRYFQIPILSSILRVESVAIILRALYIIPASLLNKHLEFKKIAAITLSATIISVLFAIVFAYNGLGVWSLVVKNIVLQCSLCVLYWSFGETVFDFRFSVKSFRNLFGFGSFIALSNIVENVFTNIESFIIGKHYRTEVLGYYSQAKSLGQIPIYSLSMVVNQVLFPTLSKLQGQNEVFITGARKSLISITYIAFPLIILLCILAEPIVVLLYTEKWLSVVPFLRIVCIAGLINSVIHLNFSILKSMGYSNMLLYAQLSINCLKLLLLVIGMKWGIMGMLWGNVIGTYLGCGVLALLSGRVINYGFITQFKDLYPMLILSILPGIGILWLLRFLQLNNWFIVVIICVIYVFCYIFLSYIFKMRGFSIYKEILISKLYHK